MGVNDNFYDPLTGLYNVSGFLEQVQKEKNCKGDSHAVLYFNVLGFSAFNSNYGYIAGNRFLIGLSQKIMDLFPESVTAREFSDHFMLLTINNNREKTVEKVEQLQKELEKLSRNLKLRLQVGIAYEEGFVHDNIYLLDKAKDACAMIRSVNDKCYSFYTDNVKKDLELRKYLLRNLDNAIDNDNIKPFYQFQVRTLTKEVCGFEALARWIDPNYGVVPPYAFIPALEEERLINKLDLHIVEDVCRDLRRFMDFGYDPSPVSVNLSRLDFELCDIFTEVNECRKSYGLPVNLLNIEITESAVTDASDFIVSQINRFRDAGYKIWMDDFGLGYSSLSNLKDYPVDVIKIDMGFLRDFDKNPRVRVILNAVICMIKDLGLHTLVEGVETKEQYDFLKEVGCEKIQGFYFGRPMHIKIGREGLIFEGVDGEENVVRESNDYDDYYENIGAVNVVVDPLMGTASKLDLQEFNDEATAIMEVDGKKISYIYANKAYERFLASIEIEDVGEANIRSNIEGIYENEAFLRVARKAEYSKDGYTETDFIINGYVINSRIKYIARAGNKAAYVVVSNNLSTHAEVSQAGYMTRAVSHILSQFIRVDVFDVEGNAQNIFLNTEQDRITDKILETKLAPSVYANRYLRREDVKEFTEFYDMSTVLDRTINSGKDYVRKIFVDLGDRAQVYTIMPVRQGPEWRFLSTAAYVDDICLMLDREKETDE